jgi:DMSO/TMAO reductase YedYZ molybdopterin-dependent catalytic subunit
MDSSLDQLDRRQFLIRLGAASATITVVGAGVSALLNSMGAGASTPRVPESERINGTPESVTQQQSAFPNANDPVLPVPGTRPEYTPVEQHYRIDIAAVPPVLDEADWRLPITGLVDNPLSLSLADIRNNFTAIDQYITMSCISNRVGGDLISTTRWTGVPFRDILEQAKLQPGATHVKIMAADGFDETVALDIPLNDPECVICYAWDGQPLAVRNGFPIRIHIPNRFGMKQPKWITSMEVIDHDEDGFWVRRGWSKDAILRATSVIDTVATDEIITRDNQQFVPIGGIAWAGPRGVSKVEVQVDGGDWTEAQLRAPLNNDLEHYKTWRIWRYEWPFAEGDHTFAVRMFEADGTEQITRVEDVRPDGATGIFGYQVNL